MLLAFAVPASAGGINLAWDDCGAAGMQVKHFGCDSNAGIDVLCASFSPPDTLRGVTGFEARLDFCWPQVTSYWQLEPGACRAGQLSAGTDPSDAPPACLTGWSSPDATIHQYALGNRAGRDASLIVNVSFQAPVTVTDDLEYFAFKAVLRHGKTVGSGACAGCNQAVCISFGDFVLTRPTAEQNDVRIQNPLNRHSVEWQGTGNPYCCNVPIRATTWGTIKGLYR